MVQQLNHATTYLSSACRHHAEITQSHTFAALIRLSTTTHNHLTFNTSKISSNNSENSAYWQITPLDFYLTLALFKFPDVRSHGRQTSIDPVCSPNSLDPDKSSVAILLSPNSCYSLKLIPGTKALVFTLEKRTISYLSVSARIRVIDPYVFLGFFLITI